MLKSQRVTVVSLEKRSFMHIRLTATICGKWEEKREVKELSEIVGLLSVFGATELIFKMMKLFYMFVKVEKSCSSIDKLGEQTLRVNLEHFTFIYSLQIMSTTCTLHGYTPSTFPCFFSRPTSFFRGKNPEFSKKLQDADQI